MAITSSMGYLPGSIPSPVPLNVPQTPNPTTPAPRTFAGNVPSPMTTGAFNAPNPMDFTHSPDYQYQLDQAAKARQRSAAARGTLLTGGTVKALQSDAEGIAAGDYQNAFNRALQSYDTNRATNQQNFGQGIDAYQAGLGAFNANVGADATYGRLGLETNNTIYDRNRQAALDAQANQQQLNGYNAANNTLAGLQAADEYARQVAAARASTGIGGPNTSIQGQLMGRDLVNRAAPTLDYNAGTRLSSVGFGR